MNTDNVNNTINFENNELACTKNNELAHMPKTATKTTYYFNRAEKSMNCSKLLIILAGVPINAMAKRDGSR